MHSFISPSGAHCTEKCDAAGLRQFLVNRRIAFLRQWGKYKFPTAVDHLDPDRAEALKGDMFHDILAKKLQFHLMGLGKKFDVVMALTNAGGEEFEIDVMRSIIADILNKAEEAKQIWIEKRFENEGVDSGGSPDFAMITEDTLIVRDLKTGRLDVKADNPQFKRYACGIMDRLGWSDTITTVVLKVDSIHFAGETHTMTVDELIEYRDTIFHPAMVKGNMINPEATAGDHCVYCSARIHCREFRQHVGDEKIDQLFNRDFVEVTPPQLEQMWERVKLLSKAEDAVKAEMLSRMEMQMSDDFTQYKSKQGNQYNRIHDEAGLKKYLEGTGHGGDSLYKPKMKTVKQLLNDCKDLDEKAIEPYTKSGRNKPSIVLK